MAATEAPQRSAGGDAHLGVSVGGRRVGGGISLALPGSVQHQEARGQHRAEKAQRQLDRVDQRGRCGDAEGEAQRAALVFALEPVFATAFAWLLLGETIGWIGALGAALVLGAVLGVELIGSRGEA